MQYATTVNKYGNVYAEHFGAWYPVICAVCKHYRVGTREWRNLDTADVALSSCAERSGSALNDRWLLRSTLLILALRSLKIVRLLNWRLTAWDNYNIGKFPDDSLCQPGLLFGLFLFVCHWSSSISKIVIGFPRTVSVRWPMILNCEPRGSNNSYSSLLDTASM